MQKEKILICIPTYNEKENISSLIKTIFSFQKDCHILIIDDNSPDGTADIVKEEKDYNKRIFLLERSKKNGLGGAYIKGFKWALKHKYILVFQCDADFSHHPRYIELFLEAFRNGADLVVGSRNIAHGGVENWSLMRRLLSLFGSFYGRMVLGIQVKDLTGGFNAYKLKTLESLDLDSIKSNGYVFQIELKYRSLLKGFKVVEVPIIFKDRVKGNSKMNLGIVLEAVWRVIFLKYTCKKKELT